MKILKFSVLFFAWTCLLFLTQSCQDECDDVLCQNGGTCVDGTCDCPEGYTGSNCETFDPTQIQTLLDAGITPMELIDSGIPLESLYGKSYAGGLIFYIDVNNQLAANGMVAALSDQSPGAEWGCPSILGPLVLTETSLGTGLANTNEIVEECSQEGIAARLCTELVLNGQGDWFLPSQDELNLMWENLADVDGNNQNTGSSDANNLGGFAAAHYWSSSSFGAINTIVQNFSNGEVTAKGRGASARVRAVRNF